MATLGGQCLPDCHRPIPLHHAEGEIHKPPDQRQSRQQRLFPDGRDNYQGQYRQGKYRVDNGNTVPGEPLVTEGPKQQGTVSGAGIQQTVGSIAQGTEQQGAGKAQAGATTDQAVQGQGTDQPSKRNKNQRVGELAMVFQE